MKKVILFAFAGLLLALTACENEDQDVSPDKKALLTGSIWKPDAVFADGQKLSKQGVPNVFAWSVKFDTDGTYTFFTPGGESSSKWAFNSDQTEIIFNGGKNTWKIADLEQGKFTYKAVLILVDDQDRERTYNGEFHLKPAN